MMSSAPRAATDYMHRRSRCGHITRSVMPTLKGQWRPDAFAPGQLQQLAADRDVF